MRGANLFLQGQGIKDRREQEFWLRKIQESQMKTEELRQQQMIGQIAAQQEGRTVQQETRARLKEAETMRATSLQPFMSAQEAFATGGGAEIGPSLTMTPENLGRAMLPYAAKFGSVEDFTRLATGLMPKQDLTTSEPEILMLPETDPRRIGYIKGKQILQKPPDISGSDYKTIQDKTSPTGWSYQHITDPTKIIKSAPPPRSERITEAERDPDAHKFSQGLLDAKRTEQSALFMEKLSEVEQQRSESRLREKTKSNYLARGGNLKKFDQFWKQNVYGTMELDPEDIVTLKEYQTPDEAISHVERAYRANMIGPEVREKAMALISGNRKKWNEWRATR